ncbi:MULTISPECIES: response regulator [Methylobacterium]|jgi:DNA-binding NtrC family response regulator|uniref:response regulator n=1 Tax=Methylobacterium TaxID=407 RepID=UPI0008E99653|nr:MULTISPECIES: response regulator [Methylobacterium]MBK3395853.1 response regulator [Methylobacterium ajmalii]MBK3412154.1 response regulator [Methylobacterium ajmalii]MBK3420385.1 response regulator [Methylobacterium ajmalii]MBZ6412067.1 response regulator [Methylobacterium sp.]SFF13234.1 Response regulator receiver domain-containing protein [Methylobacterium sp. yr596]
MGRAAPTAPIAVVVEDDESVRDFAAAILEETDLDVIACRSAADALAVMREHGSEVALLFTEVQLAGEMDGAALARTVERDWPDVRVVVTSRPGAAQAVPDHAVYMQKPWRPLDVLVEAERAAHASA